MVLLAGVLAAERSNYCPQFCVGAGLRPKAMQEIRRLRRQLGAEVERLLPGQEVVRQGLEEPSQEQARLLAQLLLAGSPDTVARRVPQEEGGEKGAYRAGAMEQPCYIHPASVLRKAAPEWIVYQELFENSAGRIVMRGVTGIDPSWLPTLCPGLCSLGAPLDTPPPRYCVTTGRVLATYRGTLGPQAWPLPPTEQEMESGLDKVKWLGRFLLEGVLAPQLQQFTTSLLSNPLIMIKSWSNLQKRTELLVNALTSRGVESGRALAVAWSTEPEFLLAAFLAWVPEVLHPEVRKVWPPAVLPS